MIEATNLRQSIPKRDKKFFFSKLSYSMDNGVFLQDKSDGP
jgi:hypothetical protein